MEQRRVYGKSHWYHETQARNQTVDVLALVPEAAHVTDRFLLDVPRSAHLELPDNDWSGISREIADHLFPREIAVTRLHTFTLYERISTALTVAQVAGVQRLCNHYAARLAPLPGPDSSRESNSRLAQITQFARQLAGSPSVIGAHSRQQLDSVGLTAPDIVLISQIVGFVGYQARAIALVQAIEEIPARWIPGMPVLDDAPAALFSDADICWHCAVETPHKMSDRPEPPEEQCAQPLKVLAPLLVWDETLLSAFNTLIRGFDLTPASQGLAELVTSRINGSPGCVQQPVNADKLIHRLLSEKHDAFEADLPHSPALIRAMQLLTRVPSRFSIAELTPLYEDGFARKEILSLLLWCAITGWLNRLKIALGEVRPIT